MSNYPQPVDVIVHYPVTRDGWRTLQNRVTQLHIHNTGESMKDFVWNVIYHDSNAHKIGIFNVFDHCGFMKDVQLYLRKCKDRPSFEQEVKRSLKYYFWSKFEWEIIIGPWGSSNDTQEIKVDACWQVLNNWERFIDYLWSKKRKRPDSSRENQAI